MKKLLPILLCLLLILSGCAQRTTQTTPSTQPQTVPTKTQTEPSSEPETEPVVSEEPSPEEVHIGYDPDDGKIVVYMGIGSPHFRIYSIAPAGTEDWVRLASDADCYNEDVHSFYGMIRYTAETENEDCTLWDLKAEFIPEEFADVPNLEGDKEYQCEFFGNLEIRDGETRIVWFTDGASPVEPIPENAVFCPKCPEKFESAN